MFLTNVGGKSQEPCACGSLLNHWTHVGGMSLPPHCPEVNCINNTEVGALVQTPGAADDTWYVVPLCRTCASRTGETIRISDAIRLVPAAPGPDCG